MNYYSDPNAYPAGGYPPTAAVPGAGYAYPSQPAGYPPAVDQAQGYGYPQSTVYPVDPYGAGAQPQSYSQPYVQPYPQQYTQQPQQYAQQPQQYAQQPQQYAQQPQQYAPAYPHPPHPQQYAPQSYGATNPVVPSPSASNHPSTKPLQSSAEPSSPVAEHPEISPRIEAGSATRPGFIRQITTAIAQNIIGTDAFKGRSDFDQKPLAEPAPVDRDEDEDKAEALNAKYESSLATMPICVSFTEMTIVLGRGIAWYFKLILYLCVVDFILCLIALISIIPQLKDVFQLPSSQRPSFPTLFYISSYGSDNFKAWQAASVLSMIFIFFIGPVYSYIVKRDAEKRAKGDADAVEDPFEGQYGVDNGQAVDAIHYEREPLWQEQVVARIISLSVFALVLGGQGVVTYYLQNALNSTSSS